MNRSWLIILLTLVAMLPAVAAGCSSDDDDDSPTPTTAGGDDESSTGGEVGVDDLAHAVVQIFALDDAGDPVWTGSGTVITENGMILTNAHVVDERFDEYSELGIAITDQTDEAPDLEFIAEILAVDYSLDIAVIQIERDIDGGRILENFPFVALGDSDDVEIGDEIRILGYPGIGGETITFTRGAVSGFTSERSVGNRAWIKTDATIAGGNSGGLAADANGRIVGIPTIAGSGADSSSVDCRIIQDTNGDGSLDSGDTCVPVGGFINGLRPVNLALELIDAAQGGEEYVSPYYEEGDIETTPSGGFDPEDVYISNVVFSEDVTDNDEPTEIVKLLPSGVASVCGFWDYEGMQDGMTWDATWYIDGEPNDNGSIVGDTWVGGTEGNWWVCISDQATGVPDGLYELVISVEGEPAESEAIFVGGDHRLVSLEIVNDASVEVCAVWVSPSDAQNWGVEDLGATVTLLPGEFVTIDIATGIYDFLSLDCPDDDNDSPEILTDDRGLEVASDSSYTITDSAN